jgi:hypothetical protein
VRAHSNNRQKRMAELATTTAASVYNQVYHLQKPDYSRDVTEASRTAIVFVLLISSQGTNTESRVLIEIWRELAQRFGDVKFCQMRADLCIEGYPDKNTPTVLVYKDGDIKKQIVTLRELGGVRTSTQGMPCEDFAIEWHCHTQLTVRDHVLISRADLERLLIDLGAIKLNDQRLQKKNDPADEPTSKIRQGKTSGDDDDSDWD